MKVTLPIDHNHEGTLRPAHTPFDIKPEELASLQAKGAWVHQESKVTSKKVSTKEDVKPTN